MSTTSAGVLVVAWVVWTILVWIVYHKIFVVYYFDLGQGLLKEIFFSAIGGLFLTVLTIYLYWLVAIIVLVVGLSLCVKVSEKTKRGTILVIFVILAVFVFLFGRNLKQTIFDKKENNPSSEIEYNKNYSANGLYSDYYGNEEIATDNNKNNSNETQTNKTDSETNNDVNNEEPKLDYSQVNNSQVERKNIQDYFINYNVEYDLEGYTDSTSIILSKEEAIAIADLVGYYDGWFDISGEKLYEEEKYIIAVVLTEDIYSFYREDETFGLYADNVYLNNEISYNIGKDIYTLCDMYDWIPCYHSSDLVIMKKWAKDNNIELESY